MRMTKNLAAVGCMFVLAGACLLATAQSKGTFVIYGSIVYRDLSSPGSSSYVTPGVARRYGIEAIDLVYEQRLLDVNKASPHDAKFDAAKIDQVAEEALKEPQELVALDMEDWDRFDKARTPDLYLQVLQEFRRVNRQSKVGLYGIVPQVTYGWQDNVPAKYDSLNESYREVAGAVDYFSPSLYNWKRATDDADWEYAAEYAIQAAHKFDPYKPVIPYITPEVRRDNTTTFLTYDQMLFRLRALKRLGASGCIIWTGTSNGRRAGGSFDPQAGWTRAVIDFQKE
jgi:hypothetical protein